MSFDLINYQFVPLITILICGAKCLFQKDWELFLFVDLICKSRNLLFNQREVFCISNVVIWKKVHFLTEGLVSRHLCWSLTHWFERGAPLLRRSSVIWRIKTSLWRFGAIYTGTIYYTIMKFPFLIQVFTLRTLLLHLKLGRTPFIVLDQITFGAVRTDLMELFDGFCFTVVWFVLELTRILGKQARLKIKQLIIHLH